MWDIYDLKGYSQTILAEMGIPCRMCQKQLIGLFYTVFVTPIEGNKSFGNCLAPLVAALASSSHCIQVGQVNVTIVGECYNSQHHLRVASSVNKAY